MKRRRLGGEQGITLIELAIAGLVAAMLALIGVRWISAGMATQSHSQEQDSILEDLRVARQTMGQELRFVRSITSGSATSLSFWLDADNDGVQDGGEVVTWAIHSDGTLTRATDAGVSSQEASHLVVAQSGFTYNTAQPTAATFVTILLTVDPGTGSGTEVMRASVELRNP